MFITNLHIRPATTADIPAIQAVGAAAWRDTYTAETRDRWQRLSDPAAPEYLFDQPDYYCMQVGLLASGIR